MNKTLIAALLYLIVMLSVLLLSVFVAKEQAETKTKVLEKRLADNNRVCVITDGIYKHKFPCVIDGDVAEIES